MMSEPLTREQVEKILCRFGIDIRAEWRDDLKALAATDAAIRTQLAEMTQRAEELDKLTTMQDGGIRGLHEQIRELTEQLAEAQATIARLREPLEDMLQGGKQRASMIDPRCDHTVRDLCELAGYGAVMDSAARQWRRKDAVGACLLGPCIVTVEKAVASGNEGA